MSVSAQSPAASSTDALRRVDQGFADRSTLSTSLRTFGVDLRAPAGFADIYQLPGQNGQAGQYVRQSGAISAVFPRSIYVHHDDRVQVAVPPGTVFYIGGLPEALAAPAGSATGRASATASPTSLSSGVSTALSSRADPRAVATQLDTRPTASPPASPPASPARSADAAGTHHPADQAAPAEAGERSAQPPRLQPDTPGILTSESYRVARLAQIMAGATRSSHAR